MFCFVFIFAVASGYPFSVFYFQCVFCLFPLFFLTKSLVWLAQAFPSCALRLAFFFSFARRISYLRIFFFSLPVPRPNSDPWSLTPFTTGNPFLWTKLLGFSIGKDSGALKGLSRLFSPTPLSTPERTCLHSYHDMTPAFSSPFDSHQVARTYLYLYNIWYALSGGKTYIIFSICKYTWKKVRPTWDLKNQLCVRG